MWTETCYVLVPCKKALVFWSNHERQKMSQNHTTSQPIPVSQSVSIQVALDATKWILVGHNFKGANSRPYKKH